MRKIFLSLAALTVAVAANAFQLYIQNTDIEDPDKRSVSISTAEDVPDVFGDGKVAVTFYAADKIVDVTLNNATLKGTNASEVLGFTCDENFQYVYIHLVGKNAIIADGDFTTGVLVQSPTTGSKTSAVMNFMAKDPGTASLEISGKSIIMQANYNATFCFGDLNGDAFPVTITTTSADQPVFYGSNAPTDKQYLTFWMADLTVNASENNQITMGYESLYVDGEIRTEGVTVKDHKTFAKNNVEYAGNLSIVCPYVVKVGDTSMYPDKEFTPAEIKEGTVSYDKVTRTVTLDNATIDGPLSISTNKAVIYLKGKNKFTNTTEKTDERIGFYGEAGQLNGDKDATLEINGNDKCYGIYATDGLEIGNFKNLIIEAVEKGIVGTPLVKETDVLKLNTTPMDIKTTKAAIGEFDNLIMASSAMKWSVAATYSTSSKTLVDADNNVIKEIKLDKTAALEQIANGKTANGKFIRNGQLYILRDGKTFTVTGQEVK